MKNRTWTIRVLLAACWCLWFVAGPCVKAEEPAAPKSEPSKKTGEATDGEFISIRPFVVRLQPPTVKASRKSALFHPVADGSGQSPAPASSPDDEPIIQDNSFLIEEAYNQDPGIVQNILNFTRSRNGDFLLAYTQEIPLWSLKHQFSYTIPIQHFDGGPNGIGDIALNYRYQVFGNSEAKYLFAPRFSVFVPTGDSKRDLGLGAVGYQFNLPFTVVHHKQFSTHWNAGLTHTPNAKNADGDKADVFGYNFGQSMIWTVKPRFNVFVETVWNSTQAVVGPGKTDNEDDLIVNPGIRWAYNFKNGTQIVPGISIPVGVGPSKGNVGVFVYFSIEHNWKLFGKP